MTPPPAADGELRIIIPASNEATRIASTIEDYCRHFGSNSHVVVVANGCSAGTETVVEGLRDQYPQLSLVSIGAKIGKGGAVRVGFSSGEEAFVGFTDADGSTSAQEFARLYGVLRSGSADVVMGSRWSKESILRNPQPLARRIASRTFNAIVRGLFGLHFRDTQCGAKLFRRSAVASVLPQLELSNFAFDIDLLRQLKKRGAQIREIPIEWGETFVGSQVVLLPASLSMLEAILRLRLRDSPIKRVPFIKAIARGSVIPVRNRLSLLVLNRPASWPALDALIQHFRSAGHDVRSLQVASNAVAAVRLIAWYAWAGRHEYDAVIEVKSRKAFGIPAFSVKPNALLQPPAIPRGGFDRAYDRYPVTVLRELLLEPATSDDVAERVLQHVKSRSAYSAVLDQHEEGAWSLHFTDMVTGAARRERL